MDDSLPDMSKLRKPEARACEVCGRTEIWEDGGWRIDDETGDPFCIHEWDITGEFTPVHE